MVAEIQRLRANWLRISRLQINRGSEQTVPRTAEGREISRKEPEKEAILL